MRLPSWLAALGVAVAMWLGGTGAASAQFGNCTITTTPVSFGVYNVFDASPLDSTGSIQITCFGWLRTVNVMLSKGSAPTNNPRQMVYLHPTFGESRLEYNLYLDAARSQIWGDPFPYSYSTNAWWFFLNLNLTVYGRIRQQQDVPAGSYSDLVVATINY